MRSQLFSIDIGAQSADHLHRITQPGDGHGLVGSFAAGMNLKAGSGEGFAGKRNVFDGGDQIGIDAAHDDNWLMAWHSEIPPYQAVRSS